MKPFAILALMLFLVACSTQPPAAPQPASTPVVSSPQPEVVQSTNTSTEKAWTTKTFQFTMSVDRTGFSPRVLTVPFDQRTKITLTNDDSYAHTFDVKELGLSTEVQAHETVILDFVPKSRGTYKIIDRYSSNTGELEVGNTA
jgi:heme/copper-type cytochrome/quinol oxidase subunit 2